MVLNISNLLQMNWDTDNFVEPEFPQLTNIEGKADSQSYQDLEISFLKWSKPMTGNIAPTKYVCHIYKRLS